MAYISTQEVREIRNALKSKFKGKLTFSIRRDHNSTVYVKIKHGTVDFSDILNGRDYLNINPYYLHTYGHHLEILQEIIEVIKTAPANAPGGRAWYDNSDAMTDYFDTAFYFHVMVGEYKKPYIKK